MERASRSRSKRRMTTERSRRETVRVALPAEIGDGGEIFDRPLNHMGHSSGGDVLRHPLLSLESPLHLPCKATSLLRLSSKSNEASHIDDFLGSDSEGHDNSVHEGSASSFEINPQYDLAPPSLSASLSSSDSEEELVSTADQSWVFANEPIMRSKPADTPSISTSTQQPKALPEYMALSPRNNNLRKLAKQWVVSPREEISEDTEPSSPRNRRRQGQSFGSLTSTSAPMPSSMDANTLRLTLNEDARPISFSRLSCSPPDGFLGGDAPPTPQHAAPDIPESDKKRKGRKRSKGRKSSATSLLSDEESRSRSSTADSAHKSRGSLVLSLGKLKPIKHEEDSIALRGLESALSPRGPQGPPKNMQSRNLGTENIFTKKELRRTTSTPALTPAIGDETRVVQPIFSTVPIETVILDNHFIACILFELAKEKEELGILFSLVNLFSGSGKAHTLAKYIISNELAVVDRAEIIFREDTMGMKVLSHVMQVEGASLCRHVLRRQMKKIVGAKKLLTPAEATHFAQTLILAVIEHSKYITRSMRITFRHLFALTESLFPNSGYQAIGNLLFLRLICPMVVAPPASFFKADLAKPERKRLIDVGKIVIQLANRVPSDEEVIQKFHEEYIPKLNRFYDDLMVNVTEGKTDLANDSRMKEKRADAIHVIYPFLAVNVSQVRQRLLLTNDKEAHSAVVLLYEALSKCREKVLRSSKKRGDRKKKEDAVL